MSALRAHGGGCVFVVCMYELSKVCIEGKRRWRYQVV